MIVPCGYISKSVWIILLDIHFKLKWKISLQNVISLNLNTISEKCGFTSAAYFSRVFKKQYGITPGQFRGGTA